MPKFIVNLNKMLAAKKINKYEIQVRWFDRFLKVLRDEGFTKESDNGSK